MYMACCHWRLWHEKLATMHEGLWNYNCRPRSPFIPHQYLNRQSCLLRVTIKQSKTDPFCRGVNLYLGTTDRTKLDILLYLATQGNQVGCLFITEDGKGLTGQIFPASLNSLLYKLHLDIKSFNMHSFHTEQQLQQLMFTLQTRCFAADRVTHIRTTQKCILKSLTSFPGNWLLVVFSVIPWNLMNTTYLIY